MNVHKSQILHITVKFSFDLGNYCESGGVFQTNTRIKNSGTFNDYSLECGREVTWWLVMYL